MTKNKLIVLLACTLMVAGVVVTEDVKRRTKKNNRVNYTRIIDSRFDQSIVKLN